MLKRQSKKNRKSIIIKKTYVSSEKINSNDIKLVTLVPPKTFSLTENTEETMQFFMSFAKNIGEQKEGTVFLVDSKSVEYVTVDALIYLIAILENRVTNYRKKYNFIGNYPEDKEANRVYQESGFNKYVQSKRKNLPKSNEKMHIVSGLKNDPEIAREFCDFVIRTLGKTRKDTMPLQTILIELMSNVFHHAYEKNSFMAKRWYLYAEHFEDYVRFVFVDTGQGIAKTVRKNFKEIIGSILGLKPKDSKLIGSTFSGELKRSATGESFRGNGLHSVKRKVESGPFRSFEVFSGKGMVRLLSEDEGKSVKEEDYENTLYGTLFSFIIQ